MILKVLQKEKKRRPTEHPDTFNSFGLGNRLQKSKFWGFQAKPSPSHPDTSSSGYIEHRRVSASQFATVPQFASSLVFFCQNGATLRRMQAQPP